MSPDAPQPEQSVSNGMRGIWQLATLCVALLFATAREWAEMAHQWWNIDTYSHILLIPPIIVWLVWLRRSEMSEITWRPWWSGLLWMSLGLALWLAGRTSDINLIAHVGTVMALQGAVVTMIGLPTSLVLALPIAYSSFLVPFGDEIVPQLQDITAHLATWLTVLSGIATVSDGIFIDTPAGLFIVAEACSGVKFLIAMVALGVLVIFTSFESWSRRAWFMLACVIVPIIANGIRAWATIFIAQYVGAEAAGSFDHIVYGWFFFAIVILIVIGVAWRKFERDPEDAGWTADEAHTLSATHGLDALTIGRTLTFCLALAVALAFAVLGQLV